MLITLTGPSLTGKSTLATDLKKYNCEELVSFTTRLARTHEVEGVNYWFITQEKIQELLVNQQLMELIIKEGKSYGIAKSELDRVMSLGKTGVLVVAPEGLTQIEEYCRLHSVPLFSTFINNDKELLFKRFLARFRDDHKADDTPEKKEERLNVYTQRLMSFDKEYTEWSLPALSGERHYDMVISRFDSDNTQEVIEEILSQAQQKFTSKKRNRIV